MAKLSRYVVSTDALNFRDSEQIRVILSTRSGKTVVVSESLWSELRAGNVDATTDPDIMLRLAGAEILVTDDEDELQTILDQNKLAVENERTLSYTLQPGADCQLGCHYCGQEHRKVFMSGQEQDLVLDRIRAAVESRSLELDTLAITWYGGEPLMALKEIRRMSVALQVIAADNDLTYLADIITNGVSLTPSIATELISELGVSRFQITVDGPAQVHDQRRVTKKGGATFDRIFSNIVKAVQTDAFISGNCILNLRCNVDAENAPYVDQLIDLVIEAGIQKYVLMSFAPVTDWGEVKGSENGLVRSDFARLEIRWLSKLMRHDFQVQLLPRRRFGACMVVNPASEVIDAYGQVYSCWEMPYTKTYQDVVEVRLPFPTLSPYGETGGKTEDNKSMGWKLRNWHDEILNDEYGCTKCEFLPVCGGACPKSWIEGKPPCPSFKFNTPDKLAMSVLHSLGEEGIKFDRV